MGTGDDVEASATPTSLWLVPAEPTRAMLRMHIDQLALEHATPSFEPHVTLASAVADGRAVADAVERVAKTLPPLTLVAGVTGHGVERFKAIFIEFADDRIRQLAHELCDHLGVDFDRARLEPHLSMLYLADLPAATRASIAARHSFIGTPMRFDTLVASHPGEGRDDVARWQTTVARLLRG